MGIGCTVRLRISEYYQQPAANSLVQVQADEPGKKFLIFYWSRCIITGRRLGWYLDRKLGQAVDGP